MCSEVLQEKAQPKADLQRLWCRGDSLGTLLMQAWGVFFFTLMANIQTSALFDDLDRGVSGRCFAHSGTKYWSLMAVYHRAIWGWTNTGSKTVPYPVGERPTLADAAPGAWFDRKTNVHWTLVWALSSSKKTEFPSAYDIKPWRIQLNKNCSGRITADILF